MPGGVDLPELKLTVVSKDQNAVARLVARIAKEADGKVLRRELAAALRVAIKPAVDEIKSGANALSTGSSMSAGESLGGAIARGIGTQIKLSGITTGVSVKASKRGMPRGFVNAPKRMNATSFRHPVFGHKRAPWVTQVGSPGYFDKPLRKDIEKYRVAIAEVVAAMGERIAKR